MVFFLGVLLSESQLPVFGSSSSITQKNSFRTVADFISLFVSQMNIFSSFVFNCLRVLLYDFSRWVGKNDVSMWELGRVARGGVEEERSQRSTRSLSAIHMMFFESASREHAREPRKIYAISLARCLRSSYRSLSGSAQIFLGRALRYLDRRVGKLPSFLSALSF